MTLDLAALGARYDHTAVAGPSLEVLVGFYRDVLGGRFSHEGASNSPAGMTTSLTA